MERPFSGSGASNQPENLFSSIFCRRYHQALQSKQQRFYKYETDHNNYNPARDLSSLKNPFSCLNLYKHHPYDSKFSLHLRNRLAEVRIRTSGKAPFKVKQQSRGFKGTHPKDTNYISRTNKRKAELSKRYEEELEPISLLRKPNPTPLQDRIAKMLAEEANCTAFPERNRVDSSSSFPGLYDGVRKPSLVHAQCQSFPQDFELNFVSRDCNCFVKNDSEVSSHEEKDAGNSNAVAMHKPMSYLRRFGHIQQSTEKGDMQRTYSSERCTTLKSLTNIVDGLKFGKHNKEIFSNKITMPGFCTSSFKFNSNLVEAVNVTPILESKKFVLPPIESNVSPSCVNLLDSEGHLPMPDNSPSSKAADEDWNSSSASSYAGYTSTEELQQVDRIPFNSFGSSKSKPVQEGNPPKNPPQSTSRLQFFTNSPLQLLFRSPDKNNDCQSPGPSRLERRSTPFDSDNSRDSTRARTGKQNSLPPVIARKDYLLKRRDSWNHDADDEASATNLLTSNPRKMKYLSRTSENQFRKAGQVYNTGTKTSGPQRRKRRHKARERELPDAAMSSSNTVNEPVVVRKKPRRKKKTGRSSSQNADSRKKRKGADEEQGRRSSSLGSEGDDEMDDEDEEDLAWL